MKRLATIVTILSLLGLILGSRGEAADDAAATPYSGDISSCSTLTGDWGGLRNQLAEKGVTLDQSITQAGQGVVDGGKSGAWQYGGRNLPTIRTARH